MKFMPITREEKILILSTKSPFLGAIKISSRATFAEIDWQFLIGYRHPAGSCAYAGNLLK